MSKSSQLTVDEYLIPAEPTSAEIKIKGSRFLASVFPILNRDNAEDVLVKVRKRYYNATHNCFAYRIDKDIFRYSDDGEPTGTAGKPILQSIEGHGLFEILCVVTRYYGGTKLGTGGLIRAYSNAANEAFQNLKNKIMVRSQSRTLSFGYDLENIVRKILMEHKGRITESDYSDRIMMNVTVPNSLTEQFEATILDKTNSIVKIN